MARSARLSAREVVVGMVAGARDIRSHPAAAAALLAIGVHRLCFGLLTLLTLLLYRNTFDARGGLFPGGMLGLGELVAATAAGTLLAAVVTPPVVRRTGKPAWITALLAGGGVAQLALGLPFLPPAIVAAGFVLGLVGQSVKICVDTTLQETIDDDHRGRVFSFYDTLFNVTFVVALVAGAFLLPVSGVSVPVLVLVCATYLVGAVAFARASRRR
jgi:hypothetical protein